MVKRRIHHRGTEDTEDSQRNFGQHITRLLFLGAGSMAASHARHFAAIPGVTLAGAVDVDPARLSAFAQKHGIGQTSATLEQAIAQNTFDACANVTPDSVHHATTMQLIAAGKHVFCEKPLEVPIRQIVANAGLEGSVVVNRIIENKSETWGFNAQTEKYVDTIEAGIVDPAKVVRTALQNAASVAGLLITTEAMVGDKPAKAAAGGMPGGGGMGGMGGMGGGMDY